MKVSKKIINLETETAFAILAKATKLEAEGKNIHRDIVSGMKAISINRYPSSKKFESDKKIKPMSSDIKHNLNLKGEFLFLKI